MSFSLYLDRIVSRDVSFHAFIISGEMDLISKYYIEFSKHASSHLMPGISLYLTALKTKGFWGQCTYDAHENSLISRPPSSLVQLHPKFFHSLDLGLPISNEPSFGFTVWRQSQKEGFLSIIYYHMCITPFLVKLFHWLRCSQIFVFVTISKKIN